jgi:hypothetical protein
MPEINSHGNLVYLLQSGCCMFEILAQRPAFKATVSADTILLKDDYSNIYTVWETYEPFPFVFCEGHGSIG